MPEQHRLKQPPAVGAVVLAAGHGIRFGRPKHELELGGRRLVDVAVDLVRPFCRELVVVLPEAHEWDGEPVSATVAGGRSRTESLRNGMVAISPDIEILVTHDCVRPLATPSQVEAAIDAILAGADAAIPGWETPDTLVRVREDGSIEHVGREGYLVAQSPSAYRRRTLDRMFDLLAEIPVDESVGVGLIGGRVVPVAGNRWSQHIVEPYDWEMFERLLRTETRPDEPPAGRRT